MTRGDLVTLAINGDYGKPRPALIIQSDEYADLDSVTVLRLTSDVDDQHMLRVTVVPSAENGLKLRSQIMIDKAATTLVVSDHAIVWLFRRECPVLGCRPGQGGWCRIVPPLVFWTVS